MDEQEQQSEMVGESMSSPTAEERRARNAELATWEPIGGGLLTVEEIVQAVREARGE
ncbi:hypothetical protein [Haloactinomyces albus]|uniref:Uncharacterized protein n=1 Tax=Haloactinomyces albus TaxID=1352928 RepID=A0AAE3ZAH9_9ACTN|nr:hypothetical protein [Haloactinomyces albus]MDR7301307.1 hypothetical protein [Haloactinomyces albus]